MPRPEFLLVVPNPWTSIDEHGCPNGIVLHDPELIPPTQRQLVGARIADAKLTVPQLSYTVGGATVVERHARHEIRIAYERQPIRVMNTRYYRNEIAQGNLFAADLDSARISNISLENFRSVDDLLAEARAAAMAEFRITNPDAPEPSDALYDGDVVEAKPAPAPVSAAKSQKPTKSEKAHED